jgi:carboxyl-terminal processing protease
VLQPFTLSDGSVLRLGVTRWLTPEQNLIKNQGVQPDSLVAQELSVQKVDAILLKETEALSTLLAQGDRQFNLGLLQLRLLAR